MVIMAIDLGHVRTGVAVSDPMEMIASPVGTVTERKDTVLLEKLAALAKEKNADMLVVGLPRNMDGSCGESAQRCQALGEQLGQMTGLPVTFWDERLTTVSAIGFLNQTDTRGKKRKAVIDTVSAVIILEDFLRSRKG
ncbi:MAG: Holliday junction resolvase RuvX [Ruminococcaceae bacterium]|nr:Holliday junction resolvase RuvX [Oscillospiraceae bacterium]